MRRVVLKIGGRVAEDAARGAQSYVDAGDQVIVVHGAGPQISAEMERRGIDVSFVDGRRVTTAEGVEVVRDSLLEVNASVCAAIGERARGLVGDEIGLEADRVPALGYVGDPRPSAPREVLGALDQGCIPVVAPLARGPLNVNADEAAAALAVGLDADEIVFLTDVPGVFVDGEVIDEIDAENAERMLADGSFEGGIVPKLTAAIHAARAGVRATIGRTAVLP